MNESGEYSVESIQITLAAVETPKETVNRSQGFVEFGKAHSYFAELAALVKRSPTQKSVTKSRAALTAGEGFVKSKDNTLAEFLKGKLFVNGKPRTRRFLKLLAKDKAEFNGYAFQVVWSTDLKTIAELHYQRFRTVAVREMNDEEEVETYYLCRDWSQRRKYGGVKPIPAFTGTASAKPQLYYHAEPDGESEYYPLPDYESALDWVKCESLLGQFHAGNVDSNFSLSNIVIVPDPQPYQTADGKTVTTATQRRQLKADFEKNFSGPGAKKVLFLFAKPGTDPDKLAKVQSISTNNNDTLYATYNSLCREQILAANRVPSPSIVGIAAGASLGGDGNTLRVAFELYFNTVCRPDQIDILEGLRDVLSGGSGGKQFAADALEQLDIKTTLPVKYTYSESVIEAVSTDDELREDIGREPLKKTARQPQSEAQRALASSAQVFALLDDMGAKVRTGELTSDVARARVELLLGYTAEEATRLFPDTVPATPTA